MTVQKPKPKQLLQPITTGTNSAMNQSHFLAITCNSLEAREKSRVQGGIGFGFACHWLKNWRESFKPITKRSNRNHVITFDSHLKTALLFVVPSFSSIQTSTTLRLVDRGYMASSGRQQARRYFLWILPMKMRLVEIVKIQIVLLSQKFLTEAASLSRTKE